MSLEAAETTLLPALREDLKLLAGSESRDGVPNWLVYDPVRNRYFNLYYSGYKMLSLWTHASSVEELVELLQQHTLIQVDQDLIDQMIKFLYVNNLLESSQPRFAYGLLDQLKASRQSLWQKIIHHYLFFRIPLVRPEAFLNATYPWIRWVFSSIFFYLILACAILGIALTLRQWDSFLSTFLHFFSWQGLMLYGVTLIVTKIIHELGHAYTAKHYGCRVATMGIAFMVMFPLLYTDVTDGWRLKRHRWRLHISLAGIAAELMLASLALLLWNFLPDSALRSAAFFVATTSWVITLLVNTNPFLRFDGYYILSDASGISNLQPRSFAFTRWWIRERLFDFGDPAPETFTLSKQSFLLVYSIVTWLYRAVIFFGIALLVYYLFFKVLGIILFIIEIYWFILRPIVKEIAHWWSKRQQMRLNINTVLTFTALAALVALFVVPWRSTVVLPAHWEAEKSAVIFAPTVARLSSSFVDFDQQVRAGETLFQLDSPLVDHELQQKARDINLVKLQISRTGANIEENRKKAELLQYGLELQAEYRATLGVQQQMQMIAPFDGYIANLDEGIRPGQWIAPDQPLAQLVQVGDGKIIAYADEAALTRIIVGAQATFSPDIWEIPPFAVTVTAIDYTNVRVLPKLFHASTYGGDIAVRNNGNDQWIPDKAIYRVTLQAEDDNIDLQRLVTGNVSIKGTREPLYSRISRQVLAVLIRESGF